MFLLKNLRLIITFVIGIVYCLLISLLIRYLPGYLVLNRQPLGLNLDDTWVLIIFVVTNLLLIVMKFIMEYPTISLLILIGVWSNFFERLLFGNVADYLPFLFSVANIADLMIWSGLIWLNLEIFFGNKKLPTAES